MKRLLSCTFISCWSTVLCITTTSTTTSVQYKHSDSNAADVITNVETDNKIPLSFLHLTV